MPFRPMASLRAVRRCQGVGWTPQEGEGDAHRRKTGAATLRALGKSHAPVHARGKRTGSCAWREIAGIYPTRARRTPLRRREIEKGGKRGKRRREESGEERSAAAGPVIWQREVESPAAGAGIWRRGPSIVHPAAGSSALPPHAALPLCFLCFVRLQICASTTHLCSSFPQGFVAASSAPRIRGCLLCSTSRQLRVRGIFSLPFFALPSPPHVLCSLLCSGFYI